MKGRTLNASHPAVLSWLLGVQEQQQESCINRNALFMSWLLQAIRDDVAVVCGGHKAPCGVCRFAVLPRRGRWK
eukprot:4873661-Amphidinium_carterae.1